MCNSIEEPRSQRVLYLVIAGPGAIARPPVNHSPQIYSAPRWNRCPALGSQDSIHAFKLAERSGLPLETSWSRSPGGASGSVDGSSTQAVSLQSAALSVLFKTDKLYIVSARLQRSPEPSGRQRTVTNTAQFWTSSTSLLLATCAYV